MILTFDLLTSKWGYESSSRSYYHHAAKFQLPMLFCSRIRVRREADRQTEGQTDRQTTVIIAYNGVDQS